MRTKLLLLFLLAFATGMSAQKKNEKWRVTELDSLAVAQEMFDDQNFVMASPYFAQIHENHPDEPFLKYLSGICYLFQPGQEEKGLKLLLQVYANNKKAEDIEFYLALGYHYIRDFEQATIMVDKFLTHKLNNAQKRGAEKLKDYCARGEIMVAPPDEGKLSDYIAIETGSAGEE